MSQALIQQKESILRTTLPERQKKLLIQAIDYSLAHPVSSSEARAQVLRRWPDAKYPDNEFKKNSKDSQ